MRPIDADAVMSVLKSERKKYKGSCTADRDARIWLQVFMGIIEGTDTVEVVTKEEAARIMEERDEAVRKLKEAGGSLKARTCEDCLYYAAHEDHKAGDCLVYYIPTGITREVLPTDRCPKIRDYRDRRSITERVTRESGFDRT